jgi:hypothetical protein
VGLVSGKDLSLWKHDSSSARRIEESVKEE